MIMWDLLLVRIPDTFVLGETLVDGKGQALTLLGILESLVLLFGFVDQLLISQVRVFE